MSYQKDADYNLYFRPGAEAFGYSEGAEAEQRLLDIVEGLDDRSTFAPGYLENIVDWSTRYHFSRARHCLVRPLDIGPQDRVLELGCGTGAITRYLGETGAQVTAVEEASSEALSVRVLPTFTFCCRSRTAGETAISLPACGRRPSTRRVLPASAGTSRTRRLLS